MENVTLTPKEQTRVQVLNSLLAEQIALDQAAELMGVSTRHARRITTAYREEGAAALAHRYALQANEHRTVGFKTDLHLWALARIGGYLVAGDA